MRQGTATALRNAVGSVDSGIHTKSPRKRLSLVSLKLSPKPLLSVARAGQSILKDGCVVLPPHRTVSILYSVVQQLATLTHQVSETNKLVLHCGPAKARDPEPDVMPTSDMSQLGEPPSNPSEGHMTMPSNYPQLTGGNSPQLREHHDFSQFLDMFSKPTACDQDSD